MKIFRYTALAAATAALLAMPTTAVADTGDEQLRKLDIMLMVTSLRCRTGKDDFQADYRKFSSSHLVTLNGAARRMEQGMVRRHGAKGAKRALDKISVGMANQYGQGHPWLGCAELKGITSDLSRSKDPAVLAQAADELLGPAPRSGGRYARR